MGLHEEIRVGLSASVTGKFSRQGQQVLEGARLWEAYTNELGGITLGSERRPVRLIHYDDESRVSTAEQNTLSLLRDDHVDILLGPYSSALTAAAAKLAEKHEKILWNHGGSSDQIFTLGLRWLVSTLSPASDYLRGLPQWLAQHAPGLKRIGLVYFSRGLFSSEVARGVWEGAEAVGLHTVEFLPVLSPLGNAEAILRELQSINPDVVVVAGRFKDEVQILQSRHLFPDPVKVVAAVAAGVHAFYQDLNQASEGVIGPSQWEPDVRFPEIQGPDAAWFVQNFQQRAGQPPDYTAAGAFAIGLVLAECIRRAGSLDDERLRAVAPELDFHTFYGRFRIHRTGRQVGHRILLTQWQQGRKVVLAGSETPEA